MRFKKYVTQFYLIIPFVPTKKEHFLREFTGGVKLSTIQIILIWEQLIAKLVSGWGRCLAV